MIPSPVVATVPDEDGLEGTAEEWRDVAWCGSTSHLTAVRVAGRRRVSPGIGLALAPQSLVAFANVRIRETGSNLSAPAVKSASLVIQLVTLCHRRSREHAHPACAPDPTMLSVAWSLTVAESSTGGRARSRLTARFWRANSPRLSPRITRRSVGAQLGRRPGFESGDADK